MACRRTPSCRLGRSDPVRVREMTVNLDTSRDLAYALKGDCFPQMTARPWDLNRPDSCHWWLVPGKEWPAFRHGKILCATAAQSPRSFLTRGATTRPFAIPEPDKFFVAVNLEKGYG